MLHCTPLNVVIPGWTVFLHQGGDCMPEDVILFQSDMTVVGNDLCDLSDYP
jgi:hypothetical protein